MKLLIVTQVVDKNHPILGFFHRWIEEFAKNCEKVIVICLEKGEYDLPKNVTVHSLGKEEGKGRLVYLWRFYRYIWTFRKQYDNVFVHMNQEYILLAGFFWKLGGRRIHLWRNHYAGSWLTDIAVALTNRVYYTSSGSYTAKFKRSKKMTIGIDTELFSCANEIKKENSLLYIGRISESKRIIHILELLALLKKDGVNYSLTIVGPCTSKADELYLQSLKEYININNIHVNFKGPTSRYNLPKEYCSHQILINLSPPGMFDKVIGEALSCGLDVITTNADLEDIVGLKKIDTDGDITKLLYNYFLHKDTYSANNDGRKFIEEYHSLSKLVTSIIESIKSN